MPQGPPRAGHPGGETHVAEASGRKCPAAVAAQEASQPALPAVDEGAERGAAEGARPPAGQQGRAEATEPPHRPGSPTGRSRTSE